VSEKQKMHSRLLDPSITGAVSLKEIRQRIWTNLVDLRKPADDSLVHKRMRQRITSRFGLYCWEDADKFDFHWHVDVLKDAQGNKVSVTAAGYYLLFVG
jgi:hypothetical protein